MIDVSSDDFTPTDTVFPVTNKNQEGQEVAVDPSPKNLMDKYFSENFVQKLVDNSNKYIRLRKIQESNAAVWKNKEVCAPFTMSNMYHFLAILYYFGMVRMP